MTFEHSNDLTHHCCVLEDGQYIDRHHGWAYSDGPWRGPLYLQVQVGDVVSFDNTGRPGVVCFVVTADDVARGYIKGPRSEHTPDDGMPRPIFLRRRTHYVPGNGHRYSVSTLAPL